MVSYFDEIYTISFGCDSSLEEKRQLYLLFVYLGGCFRGAYCGVFFLSRYIFFYPALDSSEGFECSSNQRSVGAVCVCVCMCVCVCICVCVCVCATETEREHSGV